MKSARPSALACAALLALCAEGCASRTADPPPQAEELEQARREERQKVLQQYWSERTGSLPGPAPAARSSWPDLSYPAGQYGGMWFGPRQAQDPSLTEPFR
jgi:hypothetical protein